MCTVSDEVWCFQVVVTNVTSLLKTVKTVEDEAARGTQALESSIEAISQEMKVLLKQQFISAHLVMLLVLNVNKSFLKCFDAVGWAAGRASGL